MTSIIGFVYIGNVVLLLMARGFHKLFNSPPLLDLVKMDSQAQRHFVSHSQRTPVPTVSLAASEC